MPGTADNANALPKARDRLTRMLDVEWFGQTSASICWIISVLSYGISSSGDWWQLCAASAWLLANIASIVRIRTTD